MLAFVSRPGANAAQISAVPNCVLARVTRFQSSPSPETVTVCRMSRLLGPSDATKATSSSPACAVENGGVTRAPGPSDETVVSSANVGAGGTPDGPDDTTSATP